MTLVGLDTKAVRHLGASLKGQADSLDQVLQGVDRLVAELPHYWRGADAQAFVQWWEGHRVDLRQAAESVRGLGQSAENNAAEQEQVSGGGAQGVSGRDAGGRLASAGLSAGAITGHVLGVVEGAGSVQGFFDVAGKAGAWGEGVPGAGFAVVGAAGAAAETVTGLHAAWSSVAEGDGVGGAASALGATGAAVGAVPGFVGILGGAAGEIGQYNLETLRDAGPYVGMPNPFVDGNFTEVYVDSFVDATWTVAREVPDWFDVDFGFHW